jgi:hypothetical protein
MSNEKTGGIPVRLKARGFQGKGNLPEGQSAPKARAKAVADGKRVNIPAPLCVSMG